MRKIKKYIVSFAFAAAILAVVIKPEPYLDAAYSGAVLFAKNVMPSLIPFAFVTSFMTLTGSADILFSALSAPAHALFKTTGAGGYVFAVSVLSGYPIGAKTISELRKRNCIGDECLRGVAAFGSTAGPLFVMGTVGTKLIGNAEAGAMVLAAHIAGAVINGIVFSARRRAGARNAFMPQREGKSVTRAFSEALSGAVSASLTVAACMILFNVLICMLSECGALHVAGRALEACGVPAGAGEGVATGLIEMTRGIQMISEALPADKAVPLVTALVSFGGASVHMQSMFYLEDGGIKYAGFLALKAAQTIFAYAVATLLCAIAF